MHTENSISWVRSAGFLDRIRLTKASLYIGVLAVNFVICTRVLALSSFSVLVGYVELAYLVLLGGFLGYRLLWRITNRSFSFNSLELYLFAISALPFIAAVAAKAEFDQPLLFGVLTFKDFYLFYGGLVLYYFLRTKRVDLIMVEKALILVAWFCLVYFYFMSVFTNPALHQDTLLAGSQSAKGGQVYYRFNMVFIFFGSIYYFVKAFRNRRYHLLAFSALFFAYIVFFRMDRTSMAVAAAGMVLFFVMGMSWRSQVLAFLRFVLPLLLIGLLALMALPDQVDKYQSMFTDAIGTLTGESQETGQAELRREEWDIATKYIAENPILGNGMVSGQWKEGGFNYFLGFFYPSDIGVWGQVFIYGIPGALLLYGQFLLAFYWIVRTRRRKKSVFILACQCCLFALFLDALTNGYLTVFSAQTVVLIVVIYHVYRTTIIERTSQTALE